MAHSFENLVELQTLNCPEVNCVFGFCSLLLTWRDVQHLLVKTSRPVHLKADDWKTNAAGLKVSHLYGFGLVDAEAMVVEASKWRTVPPQHTCSRVSERRTR
ncbi:proprotein convertase subtilisin/kexin type 6-like [Notothenia coriiceps]|uniref:Proprotein convertase subtilisin/kexin type 6-like n=1 Tax=Notothenia coriiceps TaxID=8208 RepID=A0A6I9NA78_9TELE|nr:PREDICTED: proprotein convertase subtilisin/kexin type 6-like [Notothenia coriiceps]